MRVLAPWGYGVAGAKAARLKRANRYRGASIGVQMLSLLVAALTMTALGKHEMCEKRFEFQLGAGTVRLLDARTSSMRARPAVERGGKRLGFGDEAFAQLGWRAAVVRADGVLVGALDSVIEAPSWEVVLVASADEGRSWSVLSRLRKPSYLGLVKSLSFASSQLGCISLEVEAGGPYVAEGGIFEACTSDGGHRWSPLRIK